jgi:ABC-2 type transport system permease protein
MIAFQLKRSSRDLVGHAILILFPLILIFFFDYLYKNISIETGMGMGGQSRITALAIGFALTFQIYGSVISFETLAEDLYSPMHDRIFASPVEIRSIILSILVSSTVVSFLQTSILLVFSSIILGASFPSLLLVLLVLLVSVVFNQLFGTVLLFLTGGVKTANMVTTIYGSIVPMTVGLYFPLPQTAFFRILRLYGTPMGLANTASLAVMEGQHRLFLICFAVLVILIALLFFCLRPLVRRISR